METSSAAAPKPGSRRAEAERSLAMAEKLLMARDLTGAATFAHRARLLDPLLPGVDQALLLISDASSLNLSFPFDLNKSMPDHNTTTTAAPAAAAASSSTNSRFWTCCPFCCNLFEYAKEFENCHLQCPNCRRAFHAVAIPSIPPLVPGADAYYCAWGFFPLGVWAPNSNPPPAGADPSAGADSKKPDLSPWKPFVPLFDGSFRPADADERRGDSGGEKPGDTAGDETRGQQANEEPLRAVPISMRPPKKKKVAKKAKKAKKPAPARGSKRLEPNGSIGENVDAENDVDDKASVGSGKAGDGQVPAKKAPNGEAVEIHEVSIEPDPVDIPGLLKLLGVRDEEMDKPCNEFGGWEK